MVHCGPNKSGSIK